MEESLLFHDEAVRPGARLRRCIVDQNVTIPSEVTIGFDAAADGQSFVVSEKGVVVVPKGYQFDLATRGQKAPSAT